MESAYGVGASNTSPCGRYKHKQGKEQARRQADSHRERVATHHRLPVVVRILTYNNVGDLQAKLFSSNDHIRALNAGDVWAVVGYSIDIVQVRPGHVQCAGHM